MDISALKSGSYVMSITPFDEKGRLDEDALREHARWMGREGITFLPAGADSGEGTLLSDEEMFRAWDISVEEAKANNFPVVVANREHPTVAESVRFAKEAEARGFDGIQIYPATLGHIITPTAEMLEAFYEELLPQVNLPVLISSNQSTGFEVPIAVHERLIGRHKNVYAFFKNNPDFLNCATFYARIAPRLPVFTGYLRLPTAFHLGGSGELDNIQNIVPRTCRKMHDGLFSGDVKAADEAYGHLVKIIGAITRYWQEEHTTRVPVYKGILRVLGRPGGYTRPPYLPLSSAQETRLAKLVDELEIRQLEGLA